MRFTPIVSLPVVLCLACAEPVPSTTDPGAITPAPKYSLWSYPFGGKPLEHSNGNKIVTGKYNSLHAIFESGQIIRYSTSLDGYSWTPLYNVSGTLPSKYGAIAADSSGNIAVVWVSNLGTNGLGTIHYAYKPVTTGVWTSVPLVTSGTEPAIAARGSTVYIAWTSIQMVQYTSFPTLTPPTTPISTGELLESTSCLNTGFRKPSITLIQDPCDPPIPRVAYLYYSDEQATPGSCQSLQTAVGPHVCERNNTTNTWALIFDDTIYDNAPTSTVDPISCSISANFTTGDTFLAWSDEQSGVARTVLAHGIGVSWTTAPFDAQRHHVHIRAQSSNNAPATRFRLAWTGNGGWFDEFFSPDTYYDTATWTGAAPAWIETFQLSAATPRAGRPQGIFWSRCTSGQYTTTNAFFEAEQVCASAEMATDASTTSPCPTTTIQPVPINLCKELIASVAVFNRPAGSVTLVDTTRLGSVTRISRNSATITTTEGRTVTASWPAGSAVISSSEEGFAVAAPSSSVHFTSREVMFQVEDDGTLTEYETVEMPPEPPVCTPSAGGA